LKFKFNMNKLIFFYLPFIICPMVVSATGNSPGEETLFSEEFVPDLKLPDKNKLISLGYSPKKSTSETQQTVRGVVTDPTGMPIPGANVIEKGTTNGVVTDFDGNYEITVGSDAVLLFSYLGFLTQEVSVDGQATLEIVLQEDQAQLDEVVVVGYGTQKRENIVGSVATVGGEEIQKSANLNVSNALTGRIPGVVATQGSGEPGYDGSNIRIRGTNTLGDSSPLVVIDGIPARAGGFERLNPADIADISVLKDASGAIYGARAANGVILVTTKRGREGKAQLSYNYNMGFTQPTVIPDLADAVQYAEMRNDLEVYKLPVNEWEPANSPQVSIPDLMEMKYWRHLRQRNLHSFEVEKIPGIIPIPTGLEKL
jgi:TonB-linked SusC/RagA family outer membrane protein